MRIDTQGEHYYFQQPAYQITHQTMKTKILLRFLILMNTAFFSVTGLAASTRYAWLDGPIHSEIVSKLIGGMKKNKNLKTFYISSPGGSSEEGMRLGRYLRKRNIHVVVVGNCHSSCANYVLLPAKQRSAAPWASIGMHGGFRSYLQKSTDHETQVPPDFKEVFEINVSYSRVRSIEETKLLKSAGINPEIIEKSAQETLFGDITLILNNEKPIQKFVIDRKKNTDFELWFPKPENYKKWGIQISPLDPSSLPIEIFDKFSSFTGTVPISNAP